MPALRELRELDDNELLQELDDYRRELFNLRFQLATGRLDNVSRIQAVKREIARIMTIFTERDLGIDRSESDKKALERETKAIERSAEEPRRKRLHARKKDEEAEADFSASSEEELTEDEV